MLRWPANGGGDVEAPNYRANHHRPTRQKSLGLVYLQSKACAQLMLFEWKSRPCVPPIESLRQINVIRKGNACTVVYLEDRTWLERPTANVKAFSGAHIRELVAVRPSEIYHLPLHRGAVLVARPLLDR